MANYIFKERENKCFYEVNEADNKEIRQLELITNNAFQWKYKDNDAILTIEKKGRHIISATLKTNAENKAVEQWEDIDKGQAVYDEEKADYVLKYGLPKIFYIFNDKYNGEEWSFYFNYYDHLILKDKDQLKPHYWYYYDYSDELSKFIYQTLSPYIKIEKGEIVLLPAERGQAGYYWTEAGYNVNDWLAGEDEEYKDYDFSKETMAGWEANNLPTALIITFLPTYFENWKYEKGKKLTGTTWFKKIWDVFGNRGVPIVLKCYSGFVHVNLYKMYRHFFNQISSITELPLSVNGREVGKSNLLIFFNCPWLEKKTPYIVNNDEE